MKRRKAMPIRKRARLPEPQEDLNATSGALFEVKDRLEPQDQARHADSVEDPLHKAAPPLATTQSE